MREVEFWRELYRNIDDDQILACLGLSGSEELKDLLMDFLEEARTTLPIRTFGRFLLKTQKELGSVSDITKTEKLQQITAFMKKPDWDIRQFWRRFKRLRLLGKQAGIELDASILFTHLISAISLSSGQMHMILSFFENSQSEKNVANLQSISTRLFGSYNPDPVGTFMGEHRSSGSENSPNDDNVAMEAKVGKKKTKPGADVAAVRRTTSNVAMPNGRVLLESDHGNGPIGASDVRGDEVAWETTRRNSTGSFVRGPQKCIRCGSTEHFWRQCPHPFKKNLMFGKDMDPEDNKSNVVQARNQMKHALVSTTDDLLNFDLTDSQTQGAGPTNDTPMVEGAPSIPQQDGGPALCGCAT